MRQIGLEIFIIFALIITNGLFSMSEIALVSARRLRLQKSADDGDGGAKAAIEISESPDRFLSTVQIGITLIGILSGAFGGAALAVHIAPFIEKIEFLAPYSETASFVIVVLIITYFSLVIGELVPKRIALNAPEKIAAIVSRPMNLISKWTSPAVWLLSTSTRLLMKIVPRSSTKDPNVTEEEIKAMIDQGTTAGVLEETEQELMESVIRLDDQRITALMTLRSKIGWINTKDKKAEIGEQITDCQYSRIIIGEGDLDNIQGFVKSKDLLDFMLKGNSIDLNAVIKLPIFVPETASALDVLEQFRESDTHVAIIVDEFGSTQGLITTNDILEAIVGDLPVNGLRKETSVKLGDGSWILDARLSNADFSKILGIGELPVSEYGKYQTLAGFIIKRLEKVPSIGDKIEWENYRFEVTEMDEKRVDRILVSKIK